MFILHSFARLYLILGFLTCPTWKHMEAVHKDTITQTEKYYKQY